MPEIGDLDSFAGGPQGSESTQESDEKYRQQMAQAQAARAQLQQEEGRARDNDDKLARIIVQFLSQQTGTEMFLLISRCVAQNIPSEIIIAVLSLIDRTAFEEIGNILRQAEHKTALLAPGDDSIHSLSEGQKQSIDEWLGNISIAAANKPHKTLETILIKKTAERSADIIQEISPALVQLSAFILRNYLAMMETYVDYETLRDFMESAYFKMIQGLEALVEGQRRLT